MSGDGAHTGHEDEDRVDGAQDGAADAGSDRLETAGDAAAAVAAYRRLDIEGGEGAPDPNRVKRVLDEAVGATPYEFELRTAEPGEGVTPVGERHVYGRELLFVLAGELRVDTDAETLRFGPNEGVLVPPNAPARPVVAGTDPCRFLSLGAP